MNESLKEEVDRLKKVNAALMEKQKESEKKVAAFQV